RLQMAVDPQLLQWVPHGDEQDDGAAGPHPLGDSRLLVRAHVAVADTDDVEPWDLGCETPCRGLGDARAAAEEVHRPIALRGELQQVAREVAPVEVRREAPPPHAGG